MFNILLFLAGFTGCDAEIKDTPALRASQSHAVLQHIHLPDRHGARMFDAVLERLEPEARARARELVRQGARVSV